MVVFSPGLAETGGAAKRSRVIVEGLAARGWEVKVVTRAGTLRRVQVTRSPGLTVVEVPGFGRPRVGAALFLLTALPLGVYWGFRATTFLAIQLTSQSTAAAISSWVTKRRYVAMSTATGPLSEVEYVLSRRTSVMRRAFLRKAAYLVAQSSLGAQELQEISSGDRVKVLPNPVRPVERFPLTGSPQAMYAGRLSEEKDLFLLMDAWASIAADHEDAVLTLLGEGGSYRSIEDDLRTRVEGDPVLSRSVTFTGWVEDVTEHFRRSDVFVLPSRTEGMSNALVEACAHGRVVVVSDIPGNRAVVGDAYSLRFDSGDAEALERLLKLALFDEATRIRAREELEFVASMFSEESVMKKIESLLRDAADSPSN